MTPEPTCEVPGCPEGALSCFGRQLCLRHGVAANRALAQQGLEDGTWEERCRAVCDWLEAKRRKKAAL